MFDEVQGDRLKAFSLFFLNCNTISSYMSMLPGADERSLHGTA